MTRRARASGSPDNAGPGNAAPRNPRPGAAPRAAAAQAAAPALVPPLGQGPALARALRLARARQLPHALVIAGARQSGKTTVARWLAAALLCPSELDRDSPCGGCRTCRRVASGHHPDLHWIEPEEDRTGIKVEQVRAVQDALLRQPVEGRARVVVIDPADALNEEGQNALLKTLEEPGADTFLLLATSRPESLLSTVRSRAQRLQVARLPDDVVARELARAGTLPAALHGAAVEFARGCLGRALEFGLERTVQLQDLVAEVLDGAQPLGPLATARKVLAGSGDRSDAVRRARDFLALLRGRAGARMRGLAAAAAGPYRSHASEPWATVLELTFLAERDLELQIPADQALAGLLLQCARLLGGRAPRGPR